MGRYKKRELLHFWVDYIKAIVSITDENYKTSPMASLSANSNFTTFDFNWNKLFLEKMPLAMEKYNQFYQIRFNNINLAFIWLDWIKNGSVIPWDFLEITWQALNIFWVELFYFLMSYFNFEFLKYKRFDLAMDFALDTTYFFKEILMDKFKEDKTLNLFQNNGKIETIYFWKKSNKDNNYQLVRIYDKILDSVKKEKLFLYHDERLNSEKEQKETGEKYKKVTRFEVEIREDLAKFYSYDSLENVNIIFAKMNKTFFKYNKQFFKFVDFENFLKLEEQQKKDFLTYNEVEEIKDKKKKKEVLEKIKNWEIEKPLTAYQSKIKRKIEGLTNSQIYGKEIINTKQEKMAVAMFLSYAKKLKNSGYNLEKLTEILIKNVDF